MNVKLLMSRLPLVAALLVVAWCGTAHAQENTVYGQQAANSESSSTADVSVFGYQALYACQYCYGNSIFGYEAARVSSGSYNTGMGIEAMYNSTSGYGNTALGGFALYNLGSGNYNTALGYDAGSCATVNGSNNVWIANCGQAKDNAWIRIGTQGTQKGINVAGIYGATCAPPCYEVVVNAKGQLGYSKTTVQAPASQADVTSLRQELAATKNLVYQLQRQVAALKAH